ncbi:PREDICTED: serine/threonine-protein phosphatase BSL1-like isoform X1 [Populus euphratica]|uniref:Serine/threonine-protein phosphatase n=1 Tax=Populus euphratica TaxID=75702 RepID=A0AAJ6THV1_POPEU|nr:PREDICTED: serine/threonine-protein phosphatase BSL1-like isoform X1 [Populus euphratica]XP_011012419.1 PREDICTED: serine/threonine-protein phosphatase BSL1-like isoform X1 [Populus euphratica]
MGSKPWLHPAPAYRTLETYWSSDDDAPGPRCSHTLTAVAATKSHGPRLILFGGVTAIEGGASSAPGIRLDGATNSVHSYDVLTRKWIRIQAAGEPPSPRAAHAAAAVGTMVVFQGGIGPAGHSTDDLYVLDLTTDKFKWHRVVVQGQGPGPRYGHVMDLVAQRYLVIVSGNDGKRALSDAWVLDTAQKPYAWQRLNPEGDRPSARMYATASARSDGMFLLCGGRDSSGTALGDAYGLLMHRNGQWEWTLAPGVSPSTRYQHAAVFVGARLHVTGGALKGGRLVEGEAAVAVLDTAAGVWLDRNGTVTSSKTSKGHAEYDPSLELMRRCRHASASVGVRIYVYGGLKGDAVVDDFLVAENSPFQSDMNSPILTSERASTITSPRSNHYNLNSFGTTTPDGGSEIPLSGGISSMDKNSMEKLREASAAEAEAANAVWQAAQAASSNPAEETSVSDDNSQVAEATSDGSDNEADVRLHPRAVVVAKEAVGNLGGMVRQLSLDQFENESRRMLPMNNDASYPARRVTRKKSPQGLHKKIISMLLRPRNWKAPANRRFFLDSYEVGELCYAAEQIFMQEPTVLQLKAPIKVFGDLHGQFGDLMRLFDEYGFPSTAGDITYIDYLFLGDYVDRGQHSLETITLLLALKIEYPENVHLIRGNHEAADINALFGFRIECIERMGESDGIWAWTRFNQLFNCLPLAALIEKKIICMHGGIGRSIHSVEQIEKLERPITMDAGSIILMDLLWSDPTENDSIEGLRPNARGPGLVTFGPDRVTDFCKKNKLQLIIRAHECVMDGFERFAQGQLITLFSATNYCGTANNAGAILVVGRGLVVVPKLIHPLPPPLQSPETSPERVIHDAWMQELNIQRPPTPTRGRPQPDLDRNSLAYI